MGGRRTGRRGTGIATPSSPDRGSNPASPSLGSGPGAWNREDAAADRAGSDGPGRDGREGTGKQNSHLIVANEVPKSLGLADAVLFIHVVIQAWAENAVFFLQSVAFDSAVNLTGLLDAS